MISFLSISWITVLFAAVVAEYEFAEWWRSKPWRVWEWLEDYLVRQAPAASRERLKLQVSRSGPDRRPEYVKKANQLLKPICDLQLITGVGIIVAGFSQLPTITFYHEEQVMSYWYLTLNSFWAARIDYLESTDTDLRTWVHRFAIFISTALGVSFQVVILLRENSPDWDNTYGPCYKWSDGSSAWPWVGGGGVYCLALLLLLNPWTAPLLDRWYYFTKTLQFNAVSNLVHHHRILSSESMDDHHGPPAFETPSTSRTYSYLMLAFWSCWTIFVWIFTHFLAVMTYGDGFYPFLMVSYISFNVWNTYDIISLRVLNTDLLSVDENRMGFGQVLPLVLMATILFNILDVSKGLSCSYPLTAVSFLTN